MRRKEINALAIRMGQIMFAVRKANSLNQVEMGNLLGLSQGAISKAESGDNPVGAFIWLHFCNRFSIPAELPLHEKAVRSRVNQLLETNPRTRKRTAF